MLPIRQYQPTDAHYIVKTCVRTLQSQFPFSKMSPVARRKLGERILSMLPKIKCLVAHDPQDPWIVYGFLAYEDEQYLSHITPTVHFIWTYKELRNNGIATSLLGQAFGKDWPPLYYTYITDDLRLHGLYNKWRLKHYDPYLAEVPINGQITRIDNRVVNAELPKKLGLGIAQGT